MSGHGMSDGLREAEETLAELVLRGVTERGNHVTAWQARDAARVVLASDWLAAREAKARAEGAAQAIYELGLWCGECDPADPDDDCCVVHHRVRPLIAGRIAREVTS